MAEVADAFECVEYERMHAKTPEEKELFSKREEEFIEWLNNAPCSRFREVQTVIRYYGKVRKKNIKHLEEEEKSGAMESMSLF